MKELGEANKMLGMQIVKDRASRTLKVSRSGYVHEILGNYRVDGAHLKLSLKEFLSSV